MGCCWFWLNPCSSLTCHCWVFLWLWRSVIVIFQSKTQIGLHLIIQWAFLKFSKIHELKKYFENHKIRILDLWITSAYWLEVGLDLKARCFMQPSYNRQNFIFYITTYTTHSEMPQTCSWQLVLLVCPSVAFQHTINIVIPRPAS